MRAALGGPRLLEDFNILSRNAAGYCDGCACSCGPPVHLEFAADVGAGSPAANDKIRASARGFEKTVKSRAGVATRTGESDGVVINNARLRLDVRSRIQ